MIRLIVYTFIYQANVALYYPSITIYCTSKLIRVMYLELLILLVAFWSLVKN